MITSFDLFKSDFFLYSGDLDTAAFNVYFSTSKNSVASLSTTYSSNVGLDNILFGSFSLSGPIQPVTRFIGANPFLYDPSKGDLLMTVMRTGGGYCGPGDL